MVATPGRVLLTLTDDNINLHQGLMVMMTIRMVMMTMTMMVVMMTMMMMAVMMMMVI